MSVMFIMIYIPCICKPVAYISILYEVLTLVCNTGDYWLFGLCPSCCIRKDVTFQKLMVFPKNAAFCVVASCRFCVNRRFGGTYRHHLQGGKICDRRRYVPPKRRFTQDLHVATSQKTTFFIVTSVKTSNLT
jgi:hypothetical protein